MFCGSAREATLRWSENARQAAGQPAESAPQATTGDEAATSDEAAPPEKPEGTSDAEWGRQLRSRGDDRAAIAALSEAIRLDPLDAVSYRERGLAQLDMDALDKAIADFDRA